MEFLKVCRISVRAHHCSSVLQSSGELQPVYPQLHPGLEGSLGQEKLFQAAEQFCYQLLMYADVQWVLAPQLAL